MRIPGREGSARPGAATSRPDRWGRRRVSAAHLLSECADVNGMSAPDGAGLTVRMTRDTAGVITSVDPAIGEMLGWRPEQLIGRLSSRLIHPEDQATAIAAWIEMITTPGSTGTWRGRYHTAGGVWEGAHAGIHPDG